MAFVEGIGDDVTVTVLVLTVGLGIFIVMYLRLVQSAQRNSTLHNTGSPSEYEPVNQPQTHDHGQHNQINETNLTQVEHEVSERIPDNSGPAQSNSAESSSANTSCAVDNTEDLRHECAPNSDHNEQSQTNTESVDQSDSPPDHERTFTPTPQSGSVVPPPQSTEDTTRNRFHSSHTEPNDQETTNEDVICVRVKYNEINRDVQVSKRITVLEFKRQCFPHEMQEGKLVRLIYSGHLLHSDHRSLNDCGIAHLSVIHCQISDTTQAPQQQEIDTDLDVGRILAPLLGIFLAGCWYAFFTHRNLFSNISIVVLIFLSMLYSVFMFASMRTH